MKHVILIGFMASGKSTVGSALSHLLMRPFYDNDLAIVQQSGISIADIFTGQGEDAFRSIEIDTLRSLLSQPPGIIATGGGIVTTEAGRAMLKEADAHVIWLKTDFQTAADRVAHDQKNVRPLFTDPQKAHELFKQRQPWYEAACSDIVNADLTGDEVAQSIVELLPKRCYIIGDPVSHSFSPYLHNAVYKLLGIDSRHYYEAERVAPSELAVAMQRMRAADVRGVSVTVPHKVSVIQYLDRVDSLAQKIGAVNTIVNENGHLCGYNTDAEGVVNPLLATIKTADLKNKKVLVVGAGGAGRAAAFAVSNTGAVVHIANRTIENATLLAKAVQGHALSIEDAIQAVNDYDIIFNATSVGMGAKGNTDTPLPNVDFSPKHIVFDAVYAPHETQLLRDARAGGAKVIHGLEMLGSQAIGQIKRYTGHDIDLQTVMKILKEKLES